MTSPLDNLAKRDGPIVPEAKDEAEFAGLVRSARNRLADARVRSLAPESRFDLPYSAAHGLCLAALRHRGFRPRHRYIVFQALPHTLGLGPEVWRVLSKAHEARNLAEYEGHVDVDERLLEDVIAACLVVSAAIDGLAS
jgi:hypothetical protein